MDELDIAIDLDEVLKFATKKHEGQLRKNGEEYITHPIKVATLVKLFKDTKNSEFLMACALLHDVLEDTDTSYVELVRNFGDEVASLVEEVTNAHYVPKLKGKALYLAEKMQYMTSYALVIKLADRLANLSDMESLDRAYQERIISETEFILAFISEKRELTNTHKKLVYAIEEKIKDIRKGWGL